MVRFEPLLGDRDGPLEQGLGQLRLAARQQDEGEALEAPSERRILRAECLLPEGNDALGERQRLVLPRFAATPERLDQHIESIGESTVSRVSNSRTAFRAASSASG